PNRLGMLAGPPPGAEFPLGRERMTIGRAEDASISINHNSVSRLHCEVHALGDGRFEIVDKGSSNGVRVNGAELRRGIVEPGDVIELGDVRFKFIGAGQIFRPTESQQLSAISDREAGDCEGAHAKIEAAIPESSRWRDSPDFKDVESAWAQSVMDRADGVADVAARRALYQRVAQSMSVDPVRRKAAADKLQQLDSLGAGAASTNAMELPVAAATTPTKSRSEDASPIAAHAEPSHRGSTAAVESPSPTPTNVDERERQLALQGTPDAKLALKQQLEPRVYGGKASEAEIRLLISTCKDLGD